MARYISKFSIIGASIYPNEIMDICGIVDELPLQGKLIGRTENMELVIRNKEGSHISAYSFDYEYISRPNDKGLNKETFTLLTLRDTLKLPLMNL